MKILVAGGAGYIGSHMIRQLGRRGYNVVVIDDLSTGFVEAVTEGRLVRGDAGCRKTLDALFSAHRIDAVMHFASFSQVGESASAPAKYYRNNVAGTIALLDAMADHGVRRFIFSSTAAVYGNPVSMPITEDHPKAPINPYGRTKKMVEEILADYDRAYGLRYASLRYFNAAGADPEGVTGERHDPETHLIPLALQVASGRRPSLAVFGRDYDTPDGTCIRDYVHVEDLCEAHLLALERLLRGEPSGTFNLGNGRGYSVLEVIHAVERVTGRRLVLADCPRRQGDPARLVASSTLARQVLGWKPRYESLDTIVSHAWQWEKHLAALALEREERCANQQAAWKGTT